MILLILFFCISIFLYTVLIGANTVVIKSIFIIVILIVIYQTSCKTVKYGFNKLTIKRNILNNRIYEGQEITIESIIENNKRFPVVFLVIEELLPKGLRLHEKANAVNEYNGVRHKIKSSIYSYERRIKRYRARIDKRGTYFLNDMKVIIGDVFGIRNDEMEIGDKKEVLVYPRPKKIEDIKFKDKNIMGERIVKRWIHTDPIFIKGIREYCSGDRMKDINWNVTMRQNKLMVKEYDYSSDKEVIIILSSQCHKEYLSYIFSECVDKGIDVAVAIGDQCIKEGVPVGMWTNACIKSISMNTPNEVKASCTSLEHILEFSARTGYITELTLERYLLKKSHQFKINSVYVLIAPYISEEAIGIIYSLSRKGITFKIIDVSRDGSVPDMQGLEKQVVDYTVDIIEKEVKKNVVS